MRGSVPCSSSDSERRDPQAHHPRIRGQLPGRSAGGVAGRAVGVRLHVRERVAAVRRGLGPAGRAVAGGAVNLLPGLGGNDPCGVAAGFLDRDDATKAHLVSMWVAPTHRRRGVGRLLVNGIMDWARSVNAVTLRLTVTSCNDEAIRFYERMGFRKTGRTEPYTVCGHSWRCSCSLPRPKAGSRR